LSLEDERVSQLLAEIHDQPSPEEAFSRWMFVDIFILDGLMMLFVILFLIVRDIYLVSMVGAFSVAFGAVYLHVKDNAKNKLITGRDVLDAQMIVGDLEINEQIPVRDYSYVILPAKTISGKTIAYSRVDINDSLGTLKSIPTRVGGSSLLRPEVVENLVRLRLKELKELEENRRSDKKDKDKSEKKERGRFGRGVKRIKEIPHVISEEEDYMEEEHPEKSVKMEIPKIAEVEEYDGIEINDILFDDEEGK
jgi:hypothetical protein